MRMCPVLSKTRSFEFISISWGGECTDDAVIVHEPSESLKEREMISSSPGMSLLTRQLNPVRMRGDIPCHSN